MEQGQLSRAARVLRSPGVAPGNADTLAQLQDPSRRPPERLWPLPAGVASYQPAGAVPLDVAELVRNLRSARKGGAPGLSGTRAEHLQPLLEDPAATAALQEIAVQLASARVPTPIAEALCLCRMVALRKDAPGVSEAHGSSSRVRGLAVGEVFRRLVGRTLAQQYQPEFQEATAPHQFGIIAGPGIDAAVHALRLITDSDPTATITQIDGVGAYDHIRRAAMLGALRETRPIAYCH